MEENKQDMEEDKQDVEEVQDGAFNDFVAIANDTPIMIDLNNKMEIVYNVIDVCVQEQKENQYSHKKNTASRLSFLTKLPVKLCTGIHGNMKKPDLSSVIEVSILDTSHVTKAMRRILYQYYVSFSIIPTIKNLLELIPENCYNYGLNKQLKRSGYVWRRLPNTDRAILMEHPKQALERQRYLRRMNSYRIHNRPIVYIESKIVNKAHKDSRYFRNYFPEEENGFVFYIAAVENVLIECKVSVCKSISECQILFEQHFRHILNLISKPSVIVIEEIPYFRKSLPVPTVESEKSEMLKWLSLNNIPHDENSHRGELYELIQKCKTKRNLHDFDEVVRAHGHDIIRRPPRSDYLNYFNLLWKIDLKSSGDVLIEIDKKTFSYWKNLEDNLIDIERSVYREDLETEKRIDKILTMANNVDVSEWATVECEKAEDTLKKEEFVIECQNTFSEEELSQREYIQFREINKFVLNFKKNMKIGYIDPNTFTE